MTIFHQKFKNFSPLRNAGGDGKKFHFEYFKRKSHFVLTEKSFFFQPIKLKVINLNFLIIAIKTGKIVGGYGGKQFHFSSSRISFPRIFSDSDWISSLNFPFPLQQRIIIKDGKTLFTKLFLRNLIFELLRKKSEHEIINFSNVQKFLLGREEMNLKLLNNFFKKWRRKLNFLSVFACQWQPTSKLKVSFRFAGSSFDSESEFSLKTWKRAFVSHFNLNCSMRS